MTQRPELSFGLNASAFEGIGGRITSPKVKSRRTEIVVPNGKAKISYTVCFWLLHIKSQNKKAKRKKKTLEVGAVDLVRDTRVAVRTAIGANESASTDGTEHWTGDHWS